MAPRRAAQEASLDRSIEVTSPQLASLRIALVHDYLNQNGGAEKVVDTLCRMFPRAPLFTSVFDRAVMGEPWQSRDIRTSFLQRLSPRLSIAKGYLPLYPLAFESFDLSEFDLVLSSCSTFAKGVVTKPETTHVCYCYTPSRFAWMYREYTERLRFPPGIRTLLPAVISPLRTWDYSAAQRPDRMVGISKVVATRIKKYYRRDASVVYPPVDVAGYQVSESTDEYFLVVARLAAYKRIDIAIEACTRLGVPLRVVGDGPAMGALRERAGPTVQFLGRLSDDEVRSMLASCRALIWPGEEDFGLVPVEAQAAGRPVIAYRAGGAIETVIDGETGLLFSPQTADALVDAIQRFDSAHFDAARLVENARRFDISSFVAGMVSELEAGVTAQRD